MGYEKADMKKMKELDMGKIKMAIGVADGAPKEKAKAGRPKK